MELAGEFNSPLQYRCMLDKILANLQSQLSMNPERSRGGVESHPRSHISYLKKSDPKAAFFYLPKH